MLLFTSLLLSLVLLSLLLLPSTCLHNKHPSFPVAPRQCFESHDLSDSTTASPSDDQDAQLKVSIHCIVDCLGVSLEYFGNRTALLNFRRTCMLFNDLYIQYKLRQNTRFRCFEALYDNKSQGDKCQSFDDLLYSIPMVPGVYVEFWASDQYEDNFTYSPDVCRLIALHHRSRTNILRGLSVLTNNAFLSLLIWNDVYWQINPILLLIWFQNATLLMTTVCEGNETPYEPENLGAIELSRLLHGERIPFRALHAETSFWTIGRRRWSVHWKYICFRRDLMAKTCGYVGLFSGLTSVAVFGCYLIALFISKH